VTGPPSSLESRERLAGWQATLEEAGAPVPVPQVGDWGARSGYHAGRRLARDPQVTAIFASNDQMALGLLRAMHEAERRIPEEVSVVGFDDIPEAPYLTPSLTTVRQDFGEVGSRSLAVLVRAIEARGSDPRPIAGSIVAPELVIRASTMAHRSGLRSPVDSSKM
jgi:DNA-binding LacI/PurR family transcriptional regulator